MFEFWKDLFRPIRKQDPRFGPLRYLRDARMWEGNQHFAPVDHEVEVIVFGEAGGPTAEQHDFFDALAERYEGLWPAIRGLLEAAAQDCGLASTPQFRFVCLSIAEQPGDAADWDLSYETDPPSRFLFNVLFKGWTPVKVVVDS